jgi:N4-gp56 family major capsid protein
MVTFRSFVDKRPVSQAMEGDVVTLTILGQLPINTTELSEAVDVDAQAMPAPRQVSITLREYGNAVLRTNKLTELAFTQSVASDIGQEIATNMNESMDVIYRTVLDGATNKLYRNSSTNAITTTAPGTITELDTLKSDTVAASVALLRGRKAQYRDGQHYLAHVHPDVSYDLRLATGDNAWIQPHTYVDTSGIYNGEIGTFQGARFIENTRCAVAAGTPDQYNTYFMGREGMMEAVCTEPGVRVGPVTDKLNRFNPVGWYALLGVSRFRENAMQIVKSKSSLEGLAGTYDPKA